MADRIWAHPEIAWEEQKSAQIQSEWLEQRGFAIKLNVAGIDTAFIAEYGHGRPIIGFIGEYDALPGLSQDLTPRPSPIENGGHGHGCGHNLLGTGALASAAAIAEWLDSSETAPAGSAKSGGPGTVRYYGCPAEERTVGKTFMAAEGVFDDLDAAFNFHPDRINMPSKGTAVGVRDLTFRFKGIASHAGGAPEKGRSALDGVELLNIGVNYLREHVSEKVRMHYVITSGGKAPNIVPAEAEVWYYLRALENEELDEIRERVENIARGAALMTDTTVEERINGACSSVLNNNRLADLQYQVMKEIGPITFTDEELTFAAEVNSHYPKTNTKQLFDGLIIPEAFKQQADSAIDEPLVGDNFPAMDSMLVRTGSTDVGDVSRITPLSMLRTACFATRAAGHSWGIVATSGMSIGHRGMMHAAAVMALSATELYANPELLREIREEFDRAIETEPYRSPLPDSTHPPTVGESQFIPL